MNKTEKQKLFTQTALAQIDLIDSDDLTSKKDRHRTEWVTLHNLVEYLGLDVDYINWQYETFGGALFNIGRDETGYYSDQWDVVSDWYIDIREQQIKAHKEALNNITVNDVQADQEYYMGG